MWIVLLIPIALLVLRRSTTTAGEDLAEGGTVTKPDSSWANLDPTFAAALRLVFAELEAAGWRPKLFEGYRSAERQAELLAAGKSTVHTSYHQFTRAGRPAALAADVIDSSAGWSSDPFFAALQASAEAHGMESGNGWRWRDGAHVQAAPSSALAAVLSGTVDADTYLSALVT